MSIVLIYVVCILVKCNLYCNAKSCSNYLIRVPSIASTSEECNAEAIFERGKASIEYALSLSNWNQLNTSDSIRPILLTETYGSTQGLIWDDNILSHKPTIVGIRNVNIFYYNQINSIQVTYLLADGTLCSGARRGSSIGYGVSIALNEDERFIRIEGMESGSAITQLTFTSKNSSGVESTHGPFGGTGGTLFSIEGYILGFRGFASSAIHGLSAYYLSPLIKSNETFGGSGRNHPFDDNVDAIIPPVVGIKNVIVHRGNFIDSIQCNYILLGGSVSVGRRHGGNGGSPSAVTLESDDVLHRLVAKSYGTYLDQLTFYTARQNSVTKHGPYGRGSGGALHEFSGVIIGFYGYLEYYPPILTNVMSSLGVYTV